ncbi:hypothetical protein ACIQI8_01930 [Streptomyces sp. NPDC092369]
MSQRYDAAPLLAYPIHRQVRTNAGWGHPGEERAERPADEEDQ